MRRGIRKINTYCRVLGLYLFLFIFPGFIYGQISSNDSSNFSTIDFKFVEYLITNKEFNYAILILNDSQNSLQPNKNQKDSINYYTGWAYYNLKSLDSSIKYFEKISQESAFYEKSKFYQIYEQIY